MGIFRLYTGNDGQSHIEEQALASHPGLTSPQATAEIFFHELAVDTFMDWHNAPRRQYVIVLSGQMEIGRYGALGREMPIWQKISPVEDGTVAGAVHDPERAPADRVRRFGPGDANLAEDLTGKGHTTRVAGSEPVLAAVVPLA